MEITEDILSGEAIVIVDVRIQVVTIPPDGIPVEEYQKKFDSEVMPAVKIATRKELLRACSKTFPDTPVIF